MFVFFQQNHAKMGAIEENRLGVNWENDLRYRIHKHQPEDITYKHMGLGSSNFIYTLKCSLNDA